METLLDRLDARFEIDLVANDDPQANDRLMASLPDHSLVINATGMGKDITGSPLTAAGQFPNHGIAWEINYRGALDFKSQALSQVQARNLRVEDGWRYFLHGWSLTIAQALHIELTSDLFTQMALLAETVR